MAAGMTDEAYIELNDRVRAGIEWLTANDPGSRFHVWFGAGITPVSPMPAHEGTPEVRKDFDAYYKARVLFERLFARLEAEDKRRGAPDRGSLWWDFWQPKSATTGHA